MNEFGLILWVLLKFKEGDWFDDAGFENLILFRGMTVAPVWEVEGSYFGGC